MLFKLRQYTVKEKFNVVEWHWRKKHESSVLIVKEYGSGTLFMIYNLLLNNVGSSNKKRKLHEGGNPKSPEVDKLA